MQTTEASQQEVRLLSTGQAAKYLGASPTTIHRLVYSGDLPVVRKFKYFKFDVQDLNAFILRNKMVY